MNTRRRIGHQLLRKLLPLLLVLLLSASSTTITTAAAATTSTTSSSFGRRGRLPFLPLPNRVGGLTLVEGQQQQSVVEGGSVLLSRAALLQQIRGGAVDSDDDEEEEEVEDYSDDEDDDDLLFGFDEAGGFNDGDDVGLDDESEFAEDNTVDRMLDAWKKTPPFTKGYLAASFGATLVGYLFNKNQFPPILLLEWKKVITKLQVWRLLTAFLNFGPMGFGYLMTAHFVWTYMSTLERLNHNRPYDFWIMILFGQLSMVIGYPLLKLSPGFLGHNLSTFFVYIWSRYHEGIQVSMVR